MEALKDQAAIVGVGHTEYSKDSGRSEMSLAVEAIGKAIADAGLKPSDIDGITKYSMDNNDVVNPGTREVNPAYVPAIDLVGHRYISDHDLGVVFGMQAQFLF